MNAKQAWALLAAGVMAYGIVCGEGKLLSEGVDEWLAAKPILTGVVIAALALHLGNALPVNTTWSRWGSWAPGRPRGI